MGSVLRYVPQLERLEYITEQYQSQNGAMHWTSCKVVNVLLFMMENKLPKIPYETAHVTSICTKILMLTLKNFALRGTLQPSAITKLSMDFLFIFLNYFLLLFFLIEKTGYVLIGWKITPFFKHTRIQAYIGKASPSYIRKEINCAEVLRVCD